MLPDTWYPSSQIAARPIVAGWLDHSGGVYVVQVLVPTDQIPQLTGAETETEEETGIH